ncbi:apolipoprotein N-acyltransferase [Undibacterium sp. CY18W]|uniref:Apolipoprotein N-acyltransferase n=1 Tax=Undibacterium hunanense TaxID=2762292 RepID=A0ABR6ZZ15_9BURK|nr:apolipoprotein N-acyltransferase [Undibacterium hunanense]MBC3921118.1 apolipoprotein N-acyltransferase [Undibacterium hunanense]
MIKTLAGVLSSRSPPLSWRASFLLMLVAGGLNVFSFAPVNGWPLQIIGLALLFGLLLRNGNTAFTRKQTVWLAWAYGFAWLTASVSWLVIAMTVYGGMPGLLSVLALMLLTAALSIYLAAAAYALHWLRQRWQLSAMVTALLIMPALWTVAEWLRIWLLTGFPWVLSGYAHTDSPLAGYAPVIGVLGLCWLNALLAAAIALLFSPRSSQNASPHVSQNASHHAKVSGMVCIVIFAGGWGLQSISWTRPLGQPIQVRLLQGNVQQDMKFDQDHLNDSLSLYHDMLLAAPADLIVTPETALPMLTSQLPPDYLPLLNNFAQSSGSALLVGVAVHDGGDKYSNSVLGMSRQYGNQAYRYDKHHLVPFGEFIPPGFRWFVKAMAIPMGEFSTAGPIQPAMKVGSQLVMPNICYEDLFGEEIAAQLLSQYAAGEPTASILLNVSNLAWYGDSFAIPQHLQISRMRVLETGRPMLRATNTGATAVIVPGGKVVAQLPANTKGALTAKVQGYQGMTPYILLGNWGVIGLMVLSVLLGFVLRRKI